MNNTYTIKYRKSQYTKMDEQTLRIDGMAAAWLVMEGLLKGGYDTVTYMAPGGSIFTQFVL